MDTSEFRPALSLALAAAIDHLEHVDERPIGATASLAELRKRLCKPLADTGLPAEHVVEQLVRDVEGGLLGSAGGLFYAWVIGGSVPAALAADWLTSAWDQNAGLYACGPAAAVVEEAAGAWLKEILALPVDASFAFVTGCQMAHATCLAAARNALLARSGWDVETRGLTGAPRLRLVTSTERHGTLERAVRLLGLGSDCIETLPVPFTLESASLDTRTIVVLQAGDVNAGAFDDFESLIPIAHRAGAWVHIDGAFGLWAAASPQYAHLLHGAGLADSWATDGHKWLNVPYDSGYAFVRDHAAHKRAMSQRAPYLAHSSETGPDPARDQLDWNPEHSRRARAFATYAALRQLGRNGVAQMIDRCCDAARLIVQGIGELPGAEIVSAPIINQGLVRFGDDARTDAVIMRLQQQGLAFFGGTTWQGRRAMRVSVSNWRTSEAHAVRAVDAVRQALLLP